jgi:DNA-binding Lrp family transcriptional regulator
MVKDSQQYSPDELDRKLLALLQADCRISNQDLAQRINLSPPATHARLKRLEQGGFIREFVAVLDKDKLGFDLQCFIQISLRLHQPEQVKKFRALIQNIPEVLECHHITGEYDYLLKVALRNRRDLERFVVERLTPIPDIARIHTSMVLSEIKATTALPLE